jgi:sulfur-oxidizing protein SoxX
VTVRPAASLAIVALVMALSTAQARAAESAPAPLLPWEVEAGEVRAPLGGLRGDAARGREIVFSRDSNCVLCHAVPGGDPRAMGNLGPPLDGVGRRASAGALRLRIIDASQFNPQSIMPAYYRVSDRVRVAAAWQGRPVLGAQAIEDVVQYLVSLQ